MTDWIDHQRAIDRSRHVEIPDAQQIWIDAWRAAPPHLKAWKTAIGAYEPPIC